MQRSKAMCAVAQHYAIHSSARARSVAGTSRPSAFAVLSLMSCTAGAARLRITTSRQRPRRDLCYPRGGGKCSSIGRLSLTMPQNGRQAGRR